MQHRPQQQPSSFHQPPPKTIPFQNFIWPGTAHASSISSKPLASSQPQNSAWAGNSHSSSSPGQPSASSQPITSNPPRSGSRTVPKVYSRGRAQPSPHNPASEHLFRQLKEAYDKERREFNQGSGTPYNRGNRLPRALFCSACHLNHAPGDCRLEFLREKCHICGISHHGVTPTCPRLATTGQIRYMMDNLQKSREPQDLIDAARVVLSRELSRSQRIA
jgi:hypothetical protein